MLANIIIPLSKLYLFLGAILTVYLSICVWYSPKEHPVKQDFQASSTPMQFMILLFSTLGWPYLVYWALRRKFRKFKGK